MIEFNCPNCDHLYRVSESAAGRKATCKHCKVSMIVPGGTKEKRWTETQHEERTKVAPHPAANTPPPPAPIPSPPQPAAPIQPTVIVPQSPIAIQVNVERESRTAHNLGSASMILGIIALLLCWIPFVGLIGTPLSALGLLLGLVGVLFAAFRKGRGVVFPFVGVVISGLALFVAVKVTDTVFDSIDTALDNNSKVNQKAVDPTTGQSSDAPAKVNGAAPATANGAGGTEIWPNGFQGVQQGDIRVAIIKAQIGKVDLLDIFGDQGVSQEPQLIVDVSLSNLNPTKKVDYRSWSGGNFGIDGVATLEDNFGNNYRRVGFSTNRPVGRVESESIYHGKSITDVLVFEPPIDTAGFLRLEMPAKNFGGSGVLRVQIDCSAITRK